MVGRPRYRIDLFDKVSKAEAEGTKPAGYINPEFVIGLFEKPRNQ